jgi:hypothetical protein
MQLAPVPATGDFDRESSRASVFPILPMHRRLCRNAYRAETRDGRLHLNDELAARAYLTTRMPATYAAISAGLTAVVAAQPALQPRSILDVGAGPGTATWAAAAMWDSLAAARMIEASPAIRAIGERLSKTLPLEQIDWQAQRVGDGLPGHDAGRSSGPGLRAGRTRSVCTGAADRALVGVDRAGVDRRPNPGRPKGLETHPRPTRSIGRGRRPYPGSLPAR